MPSFFTKKLAGEPLFEKGFPQGALRLSPYPKFAYKRFRSLWRAVRGSAPKPHRLLKKADENFRPLPRYRRRRIAHRKLFAKLSHEKACLSEYKSTQGFRYQHRLCNIKLCPLEARAFHVRSLEFCPAQIRICKVCALYQGMVQIRAGQVRFGEITVPEIRIHKADL